MRWRLLTSSVCLCALSFATALLTTGNAAFDGSIERVSVSSSGSQAAAGGGSSSLDRTGRYVVLGSYSGDLVPDDTNNQLDVFVRDRSLGTTERVSVSSAGAQANGTSSAS